MAHCQPPGFRGCSVEDHHLYIGVIEIPALCNKLFVVLKSEPKAVLYSRFVLIICYKDHFEQILTRVF